MEIRQNHVYKKQDVFYGAEKISLVLEKTRESKYRDVNKTRVSLCMSIMAVLTSLSVLIYLTVVLARLSNNTRGEHDLSEAETVTFHEVCIDCLKLVTKLCKLSVPDSLVESLTKKEIDGVIKCCATNAKQMFAIIEALKGEQVTLTDVIQASLSDKTPPGGSHAVPMDMKIASVSVHKHMTSANIEARTNKKDKHMLTFIPGHNDPLTEHVRGVTVLENGIVIQFTGYYYIYGRVSYRSDSGIKSLQKVLTIYLTRQKSNHSRVLLTSVCTGCDNTFTGGVFLLNVGDFIQVFISEKRIVDFNNKSTYLGLFMLGGKMA